jgi:hypothetical protein
LFLLNKRPTDTAGRIFKVVPFIVGAWTTGERMQICQSGRKNFTIFTFHCTSLTSGFIVGRTLKYSSQCCIELFANCKLNKKPQTVIKYKMSLCHSFIENVFGIKQNISKCIQNELNREYRYLIPSLQLSDCTKS